MAVPMRPACRPPGAKRRTSSGRRRCTTAAGRRPSIWGDQIWVTAATEDGKSDFAICVDKNDGQHHSRHQALGEREAQPARATRSTATPRARRSSKRAASMSISAATARPASTRPAARSCGSAATCPCEHFRGPGSSPILFENLLIFHMDGFDHQYVVALDKSTGETVWKTDRNVDYGTDNGDVMKAFSTPIVIEAAGKLQLISPSSKSAFMSTTRAPARSCGASAIRSHSVGGDAALRHGLVYHQHGLRQGGPAGREAGRRRRRHQLRTSSGPRKRASAASPRRCSSET